MDDGKYLMKCGHLANAIDSNGKPCCAICAGINKGYNVVDKKIEKGTDGLEGRKAVCSDCGSAVDSNWFLPFFEYHPESDHDYFYDGCCGWD